MLNKFKKIRCYYRISDKARMGHGYDYKICFLNFIKNFNPKPYELFVIIDNSEIETIDFVKNICVQNNFNYEITHDGNSKGLLNTAIKACNNTDDTIIYLIESDYIHRSKSKEALFDIFNNFAENDYVSLYDHPDKYYPYFFNTNINLIVRGFCELDFFKNFKSKIYYLKSGWWRTSPGTCCTFACSAKTLKQDIDILKSCCINEIPNDYLLFYTLLEKGRNLYTPIPSYSGHTLLLPTGVDWKNT